MIKIDLDPGWTAREQGSTLEVTSPPRFLHGEPKRFDYPDGSVYIEHPPTFVGSALPQPRRVNFGDIITVEPPTDRPIRGMTNFMTIIDDAAFVEPSYVTAPAHRPTEIRPAQAASIDMRVSNVVVNEDNLYRAFQMPRVNAEVPPIIAGELPAADEVDVPTLQQYVSEDTVRAILEGKNKRVSMGFRWKIDFSGGNAATRWDWLLGEKSGPPPV